MEKANYKIISDFSKFELQIDYVLPLYEPLLGDSIILYNAFLNEFVDKNTSNINDLTSKLKIDQKTLKNYCKKLEGCSLLSTYNGINKMNGSKIVFFKLIKPLDPRNFFKNFLLEPVLKKKVGKIRYQVLKDQYIFPKDHFDGWTTQDISADYDEVFADVFSGEEEKEINIVSGDIPIRNIVNEKRNLDKVQFVQESLTNPQLTSNLYYHLVTDSSIDFYTFLIKTKQNPVLNNAVIKRAKNLILDVLELGLEEKIINLLFSYVYHVNDKNINLGYVKTIAIDMIKKDYLDFESVEEHLNEAINYRNHNVLGNSQWQSKKTYLSIIAKQDQNEQQIQQEQEIVQNQDDVLISKHIERYQLR